MPLTSCLIEIQENDRVEYIRDGREGKLVAIKLVPNNNSSWELVAQLKVRFDNGNIIVATANHFKPVNEDGIYYKECYPSTLLLSEDKK